MFGRLTLVLQLSRDHVVLDAGCGRGDWLKSISPEVRSAIGIDYEESMLAAAKKRTSGLSNVRIQKASLEEMLPFPDGHFNRIASTMVYGYLSSKEKVLKEFYRVLAPGGMIAIITPKKGVKFIKVLFEEMKYKSDQGTIIRDLKKLPLAAALIVSMKVAELKGVSGQWHYVDRDEFAAELESAGFEVLSIKPEYAGQAWLAVARKK